MRFLRTLSMVLAVIGGLSQAPAQAASPPAASAARTYDVLKAGRLVLTVQNKPGPLVGTALPPPDSRPAVHPFLSGSARDPMEEDALRTILDRSKDFDDFLRRLSEAGYTIRERRDN
jgi:hypothetical protein